MLNLFSKTTSWMVASLLATTVAVAAQDNNTKGRPQKSYEQGHEVAKNQLMPAYNAPACIDVRGSWDVYVTGSFLYWQARQDNLDVAIISDGYPLLGGGPFLPVNLGTTVTTTRTTGTVANADFSYGPGFKVGLGVNLDWDGWDAYAEYTWFHKTSTTNVSANSSCDEGCICPDTNDWLFPTRIMPVGITLQADSEKGFKTAHQVWNVKLDFLDLSLARSYYCGTKLSFRPFFGARGAWIRQSLRTTFSDQAIAVTNAGGQLTGFTTSDEFYSRQSGRTKSWGVGPRTGIETNWMLGCGFRLIGDLAFDILYTRYDIRNSGTIFTQYIASQGLIASDTGVGTATQKHLDMLRAHADLEMGFGWGSYFDNSNWHVDLLATYGYQVFWDQNMYRMFTDGSTGRSQVPNGNLYVHGLTLTARFDF